MATGIVSSGCRLLGYGGPSTVLFVLAIVGGITLAVLLTVRVIRSRDRLMADLRDPAQCFGFFTIVAAANVLGVRFDMAQRHEVALVLGAVSTAIWLILTYGLATVILVGPHDNSVLTQANGSWFLWVVGTQSLATAAASAGLASGSDTLAALAVALWGIGVALYLLITTIVVLRLLAAAAEPGAFGPAYWIAMGATAITALAGSQILRLSDAAPIMAATRHFVAGTSYILWAVGLWWIPLLLIIGIWRHGIRRYPLRYDTQIWSIVFPLGMYGVSSILFGQSEGLAFMIQVGSVTVVVSFLVWLLATIQMLVAGVRYASGAAYDQRDRPTDP